MAARYYKNRRGRGACVFARVRQETRTAGFTRNCALDAEEPPELSEAALLGSAHFLPASRFGAGSLEVEPTEGGIAFRLPRHSLARLVF